MTLAAAETEQKEISKPKLTLKSSNMPINKIWVFDLNVPFHSCVHIKNVYINIMFVYQNKWIIIKKYYDNPYYLYDKLS